MINAIRWPRQPNSHGLVIVSYLLLLAFLFGKTLLHPEALIISYWKGDLARHTFPLEYFGSAEMWKGHLPLWNPHIYCGAPFLGNFQSARFYIPNWLFLFLPMPLAFNLLFVGHELMAGIFMYFWAYSRKLHPLACWFSGIVFMLCGAVFCHIFAGHLTLFCGIIWTPLVFLALEKTVETKKLKWILIGMGTIALQILSGHPQSAFYCSWIAGIYFAIQIWKKPNALKSLAALFLVYVGAAGLTAAQWGATFQASLECTRGFNLPYEFVGSFSFPPECLWRLIFPDFYEKFGVYKYGRAENFWEMTPYIGTIAFMLVLFAAQRAQRQRGKYLWIMAGLVFLLAMGAYTPLFPLLYRYMPGVDHLRASTRFIVIGCAFLALLAGLGLDSLFHSSEKERRGKSRPLLFAGLFLALVSLPAFILPLDTFIRVFAPFIYFKGGFWTLPGQLGVASDLLMAGLVFLGTSFLFRWVKRDLHLAACLALIGLIELTAFAQNHFETFPWEFLRRQQSTISSFLKDHPGEYRVQSDLGDRVETGGGFDIWGHDNFIPGRYCRFLAFTQKVGVDKFINDFMGRDINFANLSPLFKLLRLKYVFSDNEKGLQIQEIPGKTLSRFQLIGEWEKKGGFGEIFDGLNDPRFPLETKVLLEETPNPAPSASRPRGTIRIKDLSTDEMEVEGVLKDSALLVLTENYAEGWKALPLPDSVQREYRVIPADYILRAVPLASGKQHFLLRYRPLSFVVGMWINLFSLLLFLTVSGFLFFRGKNK